MGKGGGGDGEALGVDVGVGTATGRTYVTEQSVFADGSPFFMIGTYFERFVYAQTFAQVDPWEERVNGKDAHEFAAMAEFGMPVAAE